jgi:phosphoenolpyruvate synthase/pyruvate phosphate dikinase
MNLLWLGDARSFDVTLARMHHRVPDGFSLPVTMMDQGHAFDLRNEIDLAISDLMACHRLPELPVAVRSSAVQEDSAMVSFAGMHETYLNVSGTEAILQAIVCFGESGRSGRALEYRRQQGLSLEKVPLAVLVQELIVSDVSIVAFSMNPVTLNRAEVLINASWGLGESLVSGTVTPTPSWCVNLISG